MDIRYYISEIFR